MNSIKAFFKEKGLYLFCLALVLAATVAGILAIRSVVRNVADLTQTRKNALEEDAGWTEPDLSVGNPAENVPVETPEPSSTSSAASSASGSSSGASSKSGGESDGAGSTAGPSAQQAALPALPVDGEVLQGFSGDELVYNETLGAWRTHNGTDYGCEAGDPVYAVKAGTVSAVKDDALWGAVVEMTDADGMTWRYCGLEDVAVDEGDSVPRGGSLGAVGAVPAEADTPHLHLECLDGEGAYRDAAAAGSGN